MPISSDAFDEGNFYLFKGRSLEVIEFMKKNKNLAFSSKEIAESLNISHPSAVTNILKKLVRVGMVEKKLPYYKFLKDVPGVDAGSPKKSTVKKKEEKKEEKPKKETKVKEEPEPVQEPEEENLEEDFPDEFPED
jgi:DNA-binding transcriptional MerR regulator